MTPTKFRDGFRATHRWARPSRRASIASQHSTGIGPPGGGRRRHPRSTARPTPRPQRLPAHPRPTRSVAYRNPGQGGENKTGITFALLDFGPGPTSASSGEHFEGRAFFLRRGFRPAENRSGKARQGRDRRRLWPPRSKTQTGLRACRHSAWMVKNLKPQDADGFRPTTTRPGAPWHHGRSCPRRSAEVNRIRPFFDCRFPSGCVLVQTRGTVDRARLSPLFLTIGRGGDL